MKPFLGKQYCKPKCTAPAVWDSTVQDCQTLTIWPSISGTMFRCQTQQIISELSTPFTTIQSVEWRRGSQGPHNSMGEILSSNQGEISGSASGQYLIITPYHSQVFDKVTLQYSLQLTFSNGKTIEAQTPITFMPEDFPKEIFDWTTDNLVRASERFQLNLQYQEQCQLNQVPIFVGPTNFTCKLTGLGHEKGTKLNGSCIIEASTMYAGAAYTLTMSYTHKNDYPSLNYTWNFQTQTYQQDPANCKFKQETYTFADGFLNPLTSVSIEAPSFSGPRANWQFGTNQSISTGTQYYTGYPDANFTLKIQKKRNYTLTYMVIMGFGPSLSQPISYCKADLKFTT
ncbi:hypothetical protein FGO68_gene10808 [Halteria grandinella]|uniref:REJ domain-containing protein n=1 Tax=Halteria grandinella TaxID=5974 RepID=A0A8J8NRM3_HALGN|nr:hypothetical protein FGO68_gene10808 [Halteria grandinella]